MEDTQAVGWSPVSLVLSSDTETARGLASLRCAVEDWKTLGTRHDSHLSIHDLVSHVLWKKKSNRFGTTSCTGAEACHATMCAKSAKGATYIRYFDCCGDLLDDVRGRPSSSYGVGQPMGMRPSTVDRSPRAWWCIAGWRLGCIRARRHAHDRRQSAARCIGHAGWVWAGVIEQTRHTRLDGPEHLEN